MPVRKQSVKLSALVLGIALLLAACHPRAGPSIPASENPSPEISAPVSGSPESSPPAAVTAGSPLPSENRRGVHYGPCPSSRENGYYEVDARVSFYDAAEGVSAFLCDRPDCSHINADCQAWVGDATSFTEYHGQLYILRGHGTVQLIRKNLPDGGIDLLAEWKGSDAVAYEAYFNLISDGMAVIALQSRVGQEESGLECRFSTLLVDLETGHQRELFPDEPELTVEALSGERAVVSFSAESNLLTEEEFARRYGKDLSYERYADRSRNQELRIYDPSFSRYTVLTSTEQGFLPYVARNLSGCTVYGKNLVYVEGDAVRLFDLDTGESRELLTLEGIIDYGIMDQKVFLLSTEGNVLDERAPITCWYADITDGELVRLENGGRTDGMAFQIFREGNSFFLDHKFRLIAKADFYAGNYENIV